MMRYHPLSVGFRIYQFIKSSFIVILLLFVLRRDSDSWIFVYGRYAFLLFAVIGLLHIVISWFVEKYEWKGRAFHIHKGIFVRRNSTIPFSKIQNVTRKTSVFHKIFGLTSLTFETAMDGEDDAVKFEVLSKKHAHFLINLVQPAKQPVVTEEHENKEAEQAIVQVPSRTVHFTPEKRDLWKASFTSLSFLAIIPIVFASLDYLETFLPDADQLNGLFEVVLASKWLFVMILVLAVIVAISFGVARTFIRYGKYEISSDDRYIYIDRGVLDESYFAIEKKKIQGLEMKQTFMKRIFGLAEVKLISSANPNKGDESLNVNSLYPFLPVKKAYELIKELLPIYQLNETKLDRLPRKSLWVKLLKPSWFWILATIGLCYFKPNAFGLDQMWWILSLVLLCLIIILRILEFLHTRYALNDDQVQWWHGGLTSRMFITKRRHVIEMSYSQTRLQRLFRVASITTMNRSTPTHIETIQDIPLPFAVIFESWYLERQEEVEIVEGNGGNPIVPI
ncbi:PH domain-containing protein [Bacillus sp. REN16]|uniref:PH domain-containing protein n=1 Tax=Bacillus sp. REN16 TaxID=2887296 RepID=UPI001E2B1599|nr:PH domain-containing protein [Bacillus sp. REN16]MCC3357701.1 PH domain-containing protein [Bacillus sp. REN16]